MWRNLHVAQIDPPPPFTPSHQEPHIFHGRLSPKHVDGDVGAFKGFRVPQAADERGEMHCGTERVRVSLSTSTWLTFLLHGSLTSLYALTLFCVFGRTFVT